jgi:hypothetical protein
LAHERIQMNQQQTEGRRNKILVCVIFAHLISRFASFKWAAQNSGVSVCLQLQGGGAT